MSDDQIKQAVRAIEQRRLFQPHVCLILGSGLGRLADRVKRAVVIPYREIPGMPTPRVAGHAGRMLLGYLAAMPVIVFQGRSHLYEGHGRDRAEFPVALAKQLGARTLIATNAAGGLNVRFQAGDLMVADSHIDLLWPKTIPSIGPASHTLVQRFDRDRMDCLALGTVARHQPCYCPRMIRAAHAVARRSGICLHQGTYVATTGPTYETRAEYRMFREIGGDAVGMSTVPEVVAARSLGMQVAAFSVITNVAALDCGQGADHGEVVNWANRSGPMLGDIIAGMLDQFAGQPD